MYKVSEKFKATMKKAARIEHVRGVIGDISSSVSFADENILSLSYSNRCSDTKDITFGSAYIGELDVSFCNIDISRGTWSGKTISLEYGLELDDDHTTEWIPCGAFIVAKAEWTDTGVSVVAYDSLSALDKIVQLNQTRGKVFDILSLAAISCGISAGRTQEEYQALINGNTELYLIEPNDIKTYRDLISWLAQVVGGFATADRNGDLIIRSFSEGRIVDRILSRNRIIGSVFSDFNSQYSGISVYDFDNSVTEYYDGTRPGGGTIALGSNPFLQYVDKETLRQNVAQIANDINYTPYQIALLNCPVYDLGDLIECKDGIAGDSLIGCVMSIEWTFKNTISLQGFGADPNLSAGKTKAEKALNSLLKQGKSNDVIYHSYISASPITITERETPVYEIKFLVADTTTINIWHELKELNEFLDENQSVQLFYYLDDELDAYTPIDTYSESGTFHTQKGDYFWLNCPAGVAHTWKVTAKTSSGTATINRGDIHAMIWGQKLVATEGGLLPEFEDTYTLTKLGTQRVVEGLYDELVHLGMPVGENSRITIDGDIRTTIEGDTRTMIIEEE